MSLADTQAHAPILEAFCNGAKAEVGLINTAQVYCYTDTRVMKSFPQLLKVLYNADVISDQAIIYWHSKGAKPQGKQHFLKVTEPLVKVGQSFDLLLLAFDLILTDLQFLEEQDSDEE